MEKNLVATIKADGLEGRCRLYIEDQSTTDDNRYQVVSITPEGAREDTEVSGVSFNDAVNAIILSWGYAGSPWDLELKGDFEEMLKDWQTDHAPEMDDLVIDEIEFDGQWIAEAHDGKTTYTLTNDGTGNIVINYSGSR